MNAVNASAPSREESATVRLEGLDNVGELDVTFLLQMRQDASAEEHFALTNAAHRLKGIALA